jgi:phosphoribosylformylglycinamidine synthase
MAAPRVLVLRAPGTNCDRETAFAFEQAGGSAELVHINRLLENPLLLQKFQILCVPGGFSYGDDISAGRILANQIRHHLREACEEFRQSQKLVLGICNGFQVLIKTGILLEDDERGPLATLAWNQRGRYEDRWVTLSVHGDRCVLLRNMHSLYVPVAHAEGQFIARDSATLAQLDQRGQLVLRYAGADVRGQVPFPENPNGSQANVAGICDATGRILGLMPHPERHIDPTQHPRWTRGEGETQGAGLALFQNAISYFRD